MGCDDNAPCNAAARNQNDSNQDGDIAPREVCEHGNVGQGQSRPDNGDPWAEVPTRLGEMLGVAYTNQHVSVGLANVFEFSLPSLDPPKRKGRLEII